MLSGTSAAPRGATYQEGGPSAEVVSLPSARRQRLQRRGSSVIGYTTGVFDMFHVGHLNILRGARARCDYLIVGVTTDDLVLRRKGRLPVVPLEERLEIVRSLKFVDEVVVQDSMDKMAAWRRLSFDVMFVGSDWQGSPTWSLLEQEFSDCGVSISYLPYTERTSSTSLRRQVFGE